jgi:hypothetical protein
VVFSQKEVRNFIAAGEVKALLKEMEARLLSSYPAYLGTPDFAARFIRKKYGEYQERQPFYKS